MSQLITICCLSHKPPLHAYTDSGTSPCISKWSDGGNHRVPKPRTGGEHRRGVLFHPIVRGSPPPPPAKIFFIILSASMLVLMGFNAFGTRLQSLWIMFFLLEKIFLEKLKTEYWTKSFLDSYDFHFFFSMLR